MIPSPEKTPEPFLKGSTISMLPYYRVCTISWAEKRTVDFLWPRKKKSSKKKAKDKEKIHGPKTSQIINSNEANSEDKGKKNIPNLWRRFSTLGMWFCFDSTSLDQEEKSLKEINIEKSLRKWKQVKNGHWPRFQISLSVRVGTKRQGAKGK